MNKYISKIKSKLIKSKKQKLLCLSTTANINNDNIIFASIRETQTTIAGNIILRSPDFIHNIISEFDGFIDSFLIDSEIKNELHNLDEIVLSKVRKSNFIMYKPNDFTVSSLDMFIALKSGNLRNKNIGIIGCGNIGAKSALIFCERSAIVYMYDIDYDKTKKVCEGLNLIKKSSSKIIPVENKQDIPNLNIIIGCTPGTTAIDVKLVSKTSEYIVDVGNGSLYPDAIINANMQNKPVYVLSSIPGYIGMIENMQNTQKLIENLNSKKITETNSIITPGILGVRGDIIVDNVKNITKIIGICDGKGDVLYQKDAENVLKQIIEENKENKTIQQLEHLDF